jgi:hypothetical protein
MQLFVISFHPKLIAFSTDTLVDGIPIQTIIHFHPVSVLQIGRHAK